MKNRYLDSFSVCYHEQHKGTGPRLRSPHFVHNKTRGLLPFLFESFIQTEFEEVVSRSGLANDEFQAAGVRTQTRTQQCHLYQRRHR